MTDLNINVSDKVTVSENRLELRLRGITGFLRAHFKWYRRLSGRLGNPTEQTISIDRSDPKITRKYHKSIEYDASGNIIDCHEHTETYNSKHR